MGANRALWNEYRATWEAFSQKLDELQAVVESKDRPRAEEALLAVEKARLTHNAARDRLPRSCRARSHLLIKKRCMPPSNGACARPPNCFGRWRASRTVRRKTTGFGRNAWSGPPTRCKAAR